MIRHLKKFGIVFTVFLFAYGAFISCLKIYIRASLVRELNLPVSLTHLRLAGSILSPLPTDINLEKIPPQDFFSAGIAYEDLLANGEINISLYKEPFRPKLDWETMLAAFQKKYAGADLRIRTLENVEELRDALLKDDIVIFSGHSNLGQGLNVWSDTLQTNTLLRVEGSWIQDPLPEVHRYSADKIILGSLPEIKAPIVMHLGCRSSIYYREAFASCAPDTSVLLTHYSWAPGESFVMALEVLFETLAERQRINDMLKIWENLYAAENLYGRSRQRRKYPEDTGFEPTLFACYTPAF